MACQRLWREQGFNMEGQESGILLPTATGPESPQASPGPSQHSAEKRKCPWTVPPALGCMHVCFFFRTKWKRQTAVGLELLAGPHTSLWKAEDCLPAPWQDTAGACWWERVQQAISAISLCALCSRSRPFFRLSFPTWMTGRLE